MAGTAEADEVEPRERRFFQRNIRAFVVREPSGDIVTVPVVVHHWGHRAKSILTWKGFRFRPGQVVVAADFSCGHRREYVRAVRPGTLSTTAPCDGCRHGSRVAWEKDLDRVRFRVRKLVFDLADVAVRPASYSRVEVDRQADRMRNLIEFILDGIEARTLPTRTTQEDEIRDRMTRHANLAGLFDEVEEQDEDEQGGRE